MVVGAAAPPPLLRVPSVTDIALPGAPEVGTVKEAMTRSGPSWMQTRLAVIALIRLGNLTVRVGRGNQVGTRPMAVFAGISTDSDNALATPGFNSGTATSTSGVSDASRMEFGDR